MVIAFLEVTEIDMAEVLLALLGLIYALIGEMFLKFNWKCIFRFTYSKVKALFDRYFLQTIKCKYFSRNFCKRFETYWFKKTEVYFVGYFHINLLVNDNFVLQENQSLHFRNLHCRLMSKYKELCQIFSLKEIIQEF